MSLHNISIIKNKIGYFKMCFSFKLLSKTYKTEQLPFLYSNLPMLPHFSGTTLQILNFIFYIKISLLFKKPSEIIIQALLYIVSADIYVR